MARAQLVEKLGIEREIWIDELLEALDSEKLLEVTFSAAAQSSDIKRVSVQGDSEFVKVIRTVLIAEGFSIEPANCSDPLPALWIAAWEQPDLSFVLRVNAETIQREVPCLFVDLSHGRHATLGPFYQPGEGACYECYRQWWRRNSHSLAEMDRAH